MENFIFQNNTKLVFGKGMISKLGGLIPADARIMLTFGGGSVKANGIYDQVVTALEGREYIEFWGIEPNPTVETLREAIALGKKNNIDFLLAVGGGSVIDGTKLVAAGICSDKDAWEIVLDKAADKQINFASVLTLPATGSEMNKGAVISRTETTEKYAFFGVESPMFSILDPEATFSLPDWQIACGLSDTFIHVLEQYLTVPGVSRIMDRWSEGLLQTVVEIAPLIRENKTNYEVMADFMLSATMALNGFTSMGVPQDWTTHMIGHEITALHGLTHGATLSIVMCGTMRVLSEQKSGKILQFGERVFGITQGNDQERIALTIERTEEFLRSLGLPTRLSDENIGEETITEIERRFNEANVHYGEAGNVDGAMARKILESCK